MKDNYTFEFYKKCLQKGLDKGYQFLSCKEYLKNKKVNKVVVLRHDVDYHPLRAYEMALVENSLGIKSTYFFRIFCNEYNLFSFENINVLKRIEKMGHEIGYHAEPVDVHAATGLSCDKAFEIGREAIKLLTDDKIIGAASHREATGFNNLTEYIALKKNDELNILYEAYDNTNLNLFENSYYITDSYEWYWRNYINGELTSKQKSLIDVLDEDVEQTIYCLIHPNLWYKKHFHLVNMYE